MKKILFIFLLSSFIFSCTPATPPSPQIVDVYASTAAQPFLDELYACADASSVTLNLTADSPDISLHLGQPDVWTGSVFQVGTEVILIAASAQSPLPNLTLEQARELFAGRGDPSVQVWVYAPGVEMQGMFEQAVMAGRSVTSFARLAVSVGHMSEALSADGNAVGILPRRGMSAGLRELFTVASIPVLVSTPSDPQGVTRKLIACLQK